MKRPSKLAILVVLVLIIVGLFVLHGLKNDRSATNVSSSSEEKRNDVVVATVGKKLINDRLTAI